MITENAMVVAYRKKAFNALMEKISKMIKYKNKYKISFFCLFLMNYVFNLFMSTTSKICGQILITACDFIAGQNYSQLVKVIFKVSSLVMRQYNDFVS